MDHQQFQLTVNTALTEKPAPRPRGRPPSNPNRKRPAEQQDSRPAKRAATQRACQKKTKATKIITPPMPIAVKQESISSQSRSTTDDEELDIDKRNLHNNMERQRRIELRNAFDDLRLLVPEIQAKEKAPKVAILRHAGRYCDQLKAIYDNNAALKAEMEKKQEVLRTRVSFLRRCLALTR